MGGTRFVLDLGQGQEGPFEKRFFRYKGIKGLTRSVPFQIDVYQPHVPELQQGLFPEGIQHDDVYFFHFDNHDYGTFTNLLLAIFPLTTAAVC